MPRVSISPGEHYHIFNRGVNKQVIFLNTAEYIRMLFLILFLQAPIPFPNVGRQVGYFQRNKNFKVNQVDLTKIIKKRQIELCAFAIMPNHVHLLLHELKEGGISAYMQRIEIAYTKYFNIKHERSGYLFQGPFQSVHVVSNEQLLHLSAYIHLNPTELTLWKKKPADYPWSSYQDFAAHNRWGELLSTEILLGQFKNQNGYVEFVETSGAKGFKPGLL